MKHVLFEFPQASQTGVDGIKLIQSGNPGWPKSNQICFLIPKRTDLLFGSRDEPDFLNETTICQIRFDQEFDKFPFRQGYTTTTKSNAGCPKSYNEDQVARALRDLAERKMEPSVEAVKRHLREEQYFQINPQPEALQNMINTIPEREKEARTLRLLGALPTNVTDCVDQACEMVRRHLLLGVAETYHELDKKSMLPVQKMQDRLHSKRLELDCSQQEDHIKSSHLKASCEQNDILQSQLEELKTGLAVMEKELISLRDQVAAKDDILAMLRPGAAQNAR